MQHDVGDVVRNFFAFTNPAGALTNPTTVTLKYKPPSSAVVSKVYGTDAEAKRAETQLNGALSDSATTITVDATTGFPAADAVFPITDETAALRLIYIDSETLRVTGGFGTLVWTVERGVGGTTAAAHLDNAPVIGPYYIDVTVTNDPGTWQTRGVGTGAVHQSVPLSFGVLASELV